LHRRHRVLRLCHTKLATVALAVLAILLGVAFEKQNVAFMVGLAFAIAASANFPALVAGPRDGGAPAVRGGPPADDPGAARALTASGRRWGQEPSWWRIADLAGRDRAGRRPLGKILIFGIAIE
jgi:hypothetical protein